jgi:hypothetical protein
MAYIGSLKQKAGKGRAYGITTAKPVSLVRCPSPACTTNRYSIEACAAASRAIGTLKGEQLT